VLFCLAEHEGSIVMFILIIERDPLYTAIQYNPMR